MAVKFLPWRKGDHGFSFIYLERRSVNKVPSHKLDFCLQLGEKSMFTSYAGEGI